MGDFVCVLSVDDALRTQGLKRLSLLFDRMVVEDLGWWFRVLADEGAEETIPEKELEWLSTHGLIDSVPSVLMVNPYGPFGKREYAEKIYSSPEGRKHFSRWFGRLEDMDAFAKRWREFIGKPELDGLVRSLPRDYPPGTAAADWRSTDTCLRLTALAYRQMKGHDAVAVLQHKGRAQFSTFDSRTHGNQSSVLGCILEAIPVPHIDTPWEEILEIRKDAELREKFRRLKNWINRLARSRMSPAEVRDSLEELMHDYSQHVKLRKLKTSTARLEFVVTIVPGVLEDLVKVRWEKLAKRFFQLRHQKIALLEAEQKAPGKEVAYICELGKKVRSTWPHREES